MTIDKKYWKDLVFVKGNFPDIKCPTCDKGHLRPIMESFNCEETFESNQLRENDDWDPMMVDYRFVLLLKCTNTDCLDINSCIGIGYNDQVTEFDKYYQECSNVIIPNYYPLYFIPSIKIIPVNDLYPEKIKIELTNSFSHFFSDLSSCANKIRVCTEILMDELKIKKTEIQKTKRRSIPLHSRILNYKKINPEVADYLLAIKWIGNSGSHVDKLTKDDVLDAYILLDHSLNKLYNNEEKKIKKLTKEINKKRAALSTKRRKSGT